VGALRARGCTVVLVEQNTRAALRVATRGYLLDRGRVAYAGSAAELLGAQRVKDVYLGPVTPSRT
jgi:branched-chain amino acid transport system ATP-binding protein